MLAPLSPPQSDAYFRSRSRGPPPSHALHPRAPSPLHPAPPADAESDAYFRSRPRGHQIGALASMQSAVIPSRRSLEERAERLARHYHDESLEVPRPPHWRGYVIRPLAVEVGAGGCIWVSWGVAWTCVGCVGWVEGGWGGVDVRCGWVGCGGVPCRLAGGLLGGWGLEGLEVVIGFAGCTVGPPSPFLRSR